MDAGATIRTLEGGRFYATSASCLDPFGTFVVHREPAVVRGGGERSRSSQHEVHSASKLETQTCIFGRGHAYYIFRVDSS